MIFFTTQWLKAARANLTPNAMEYKKRKNKNEFNGRVRTRMLELRPKHFFGTVLPVCLHPVHFPIHHAGNLSMHSTSFQVSQHSMCRRKSCHHSNVLAICDGFVPEFSPHSRHWLSFLQYSAAASAGPNRGSM